MPLARRLLPVALVLAVVSCSSEAPPTAEQVVGELSAQVPSAQLAEVITAETDPNGLLGRPGGYVSAANFTDDRVPPEFAGAGGVEAGGKVEVFADEDEASARAENIAGIVAAAPMFSEWTYQDGPVLVRVSRFLPEAQAQAYRTVLEQD